MYIVRGLIAIGDFESLVDLNTKHSRMITATLLIQNYGFRWRFEAVLIGYATLEIHKDVRQFSVSNHYIISVLVSAGSGAIRVAAHINFLDLWRCSFVTHLASYRSFIARCLVRRFRRSRLGAFFFTVFTSLSAS